MHGAHAADELAPMLAPAVPAGQGSHSPAHATLHSQKEPERHSEHAAPAVPLGE